MVEESNTSLISQKKKIDTIKKPREITIIQQNSPYSQQNKPDTLNTIDKSRSTQRTNLYDKSTRIENPQK